MQDGWILADAPLPAHPLERLAYYARLAPSTHNTQPWKFVIGEGEVDVLADESRWLRVADPDRRELQISIGCAIEGFRVAADFAGYGTTVRYFPVAEEVDFCARILVELAGPKRTQSVADLLRHLVTRRTSRRRFDAARTISDAERGHLYGSFEFGDVSLHFLSDRAALGVLAALEFDADTRLFANAAYREELSHWVGEGMLGSSWLVSKLGQFAMATLPLGNRIAREDADRVSSAPLTALLTTRNDRPLDRVHVGEAYLRLALVAESRGIRVQPVSQVLELEDTRASVAKLFDLHGRFAQHLFRLGYADADPASAPRRRLADTVVAAGERAAGS